MSSCEKYQELISRMVDGELSSREDADVRKHIRSCPDCAALFRAFSTLSGQLGSDLEEAPADLRENVMAKIRREEIRKKNRLPNILRGVLSTAAGIAVIVGVYYGVSLAKSQPLSAAVYESSVREEDVSADKAISEDAAEAEEADMTEEAAPEQAEPMAEAAVNTAEVTQAADAQVAGYGEAQPDDEWHEGDVFYPAAPERQLNNWDLSLLRELLKGTPTERTAEELEPFLRELVTLRAGDESVTVRLYELNGVLYYLDPVEEAVYQAALTPAEWDDFFA